MIKLAPSLLASDFGRLAEEVSVVENAGAHYLHLDVMDGIFVPNISFGMPVIKALRQGSGLVFDVHLMIIEPQRYIEAVAQAGADIITFHLEAVRDAAAARSLITKIRGLGKRAGVSIKPNTPINNLIELAEELDLALVMSVEPGFGGQRLLEPCLAKAAELANFAANRNLCLDIEMDGGIDLSNVKDVVAAGVNVVVAGSSVFGAKPSEAIAQFLLATNPSASL